MRGLTKIPAAEFEIMKVIWKGPAPMTTAQITAALHRKDRSLQTVLTLLKRLMARGFLSSEKRLRERSYLPIVTEEAYLKFETGQFIETFHNNSVTGLMNALYDGKGLCEEDFRALEDWLKERELTC